ncbi:Uncharacterized protein QTN25_003115 [Entamoeba marina]
MNTLYYSLSNQYVNYPTQFPLVINRVPSTTVAGSFNYGHCSPVLASEENCLVPPRQPSTQFVHYNNYGPQRLTSKNLRTNNLLELSNDEKNSRVMSWINTIQPENYYPHPIDMKE